jgi:type I restriction enzyme S subunit
MDSGQVIVDSGQVKTGYKRTEVGVIPADWEVVRLGEIGEAIIGLTYSPENVGENGLLVLRSSNIGDNQLKFDDNVFVSMEVPDRLITREGDILICVRNGSRALIGKTALIDETAAGQTFGAFMSIFRTQHYHLVFYLFQTDLIKRQIHENIGATINQITNKNLNSFQIPLPPPAEQRAIAGALSDVDALIAGLERLIAKKRAIKQGAMQQLLTGQTRLPGFSGAWETRRLGEIGTFKKGRNIPKRNLSSQGVPCVLYGEIYTRYDSVVQELVSRIPEQIAAQSVSITKGDILFAGSGETAEEIGKCFTYVGDEKAYAGGDLIILTPSEDNPIFLGYLLNSPSVNEQKSNLGQGSSVVHIYTSTLQTIEIALPPIEEQQAIAQILSDMDAEIEGLERRRDKTQAIKQGMMQELLTGRVRLVPPSASPSSP